MRVSEISIYLKGEGEGHVSFIFDIEILVDCGVYTGNLQCLFLDDKSNVDR